MTKTYLTTVEVAEMLSLSSRTLEDWRYRGGGPAFIKLGTRIIRYRLQDLENWIAPRLASNTGEAQALA